MDNPAIRVLYVDDSPEDFFLMRHLLSRSRQTNFNLDWIESYDAALDAIVRNEHDVYLIDYMLANHSGLVLMRQALAAGCQKPVILITGYGAPEMDIAAMEAGAADYLDKAELRPSVLARTLRNAVERTRTLAQLRASEEKYRDLFENATDLIQSVSLDGHIEYVNRAWQETLGYSAEEIGGLSIFEFIHPDYVAAYTAMFEELVSCGEARRVETVYLTKDGRSIILEGNMNCRLVNGQPAAARGIFRDITERKRAEEALRKSEERNRALLEAIPDLIFRISADGTYVDYKPSKVEEFYLPPQEFLGQNVQEILPPAMAQETMDYISQALHTGKTQVFEYQLPVLDTMRSYEARFALCDQDDVLCVVRDITERRQIEQALSESEARHRIVSDLIWNYACSYRFTSNNDDEARLEWVIGAFEQTTGHSIEEALSSFSLSLPVHPDDLLRFQERQRKLHSGQADVSEFRIINKRGEVRWVRSYGRPEWDDERQRVERVYIGVQDITERRQIEETLREQRILLEALLDTSNALNSTLNFEEVLDRILVNVSRVLPHDTASIMLIEEGIARPVRTMGYENHLHGADFAQSGWLSVSDTPNLKKMLETRKPFVVPDVHNFPDWVDHPWSRWIRSYAGVPISIEGEVIGFLNLDSAVPNFFAPEMVERLTLFSNQTAIAIQNARLYAQAQELAALNERQRLARELHDAVSQTLFSASMIAESLPRLWPDTPDELKETLLELHHLTRQALSEMRSLLLELRPRALMDTAIEELLGQLSEVFRRRERIETLLRVDGSFEPPPEVKIVLYRVAQEALNNIAKHARATQVSLKLTRADHALQFEVRDNGRGFDPGEVRAGHFGLQIIRERAASIRAVLKLTSEPGQGTELVLTWSSDQAT